MATTNEVLDGAVREIAHRRRMAEVDVIIWTMAMGVVRSMFCGKTKEEAVAEELAGCKLNPTYARHNLNFKLKEIGL